MNEKVQFEMTEEQIFVCVCVCVHICICVFFVTLNWWFIPELAHAPKNTVQEYLNWDIQKQNPTKVIKFKMENCLIAMSYFTQLEQLVSGGGNDAKDMQKEQRK